MRPPRPRKQVVARLFHRSCLQSHSLVEIHLIFQLLLDRTYFAMSRKFAEALQEPSALAIGQSALTGRECPMCRSMRTTIKFTKVHNQMSWALRRCRECGLHFTDPTPEPEFLNDCYAGDYHQNLRVDGATELRFGSKYERYLNRIAQYLPLGSRVLDMGCSTGLLVKMLNDRGYRAEGIELNVESAAWGREYYGVTIHDRAIEECEVAPESFDAVILADVLEHTRHPRECLTAISRYLTPDGLAFISFPDITSLESRCYFLMAKLTSASWLWKTCNVPFHVWEFTPKTAVACFEAAGFRLLDLKRTQDEPIKEATPLLKLMNLPSEIAAWPAIANRWGTQMEFIIRRKTAKQ